MQDLRSVAAGIYGGGGGDRRLRPQQPLKCPRCESLNTKFCYYNNYNLSQPRHFCKSCRRYWTKGGVLRNVPVGGGCRKPKRSSKPKPSSSSPPPSRKTSAASHSSSDSSTLTGATAAVAAAPATEVASTANALNYVNSAFDPSPAMDQEGFCPPLDLGGSFTRLMSSAFGFGDMAGNAATTTMTFPFQFHHQQKTEEMKGQDPTTYLDPTLLQQQQQQQLGVEEYERGSLTTALEWQSNNEGGDEGLFDLAGGVVAVEGQGGYWSHSSSHWGENDPTLYLP